MGCDIHGFIQIQLHETYWMNKIDLSWLFFRNYELFGALSSVRVHKNNYISNNGLPDNDCVSYLYNPSFHHDVGWFTFKELDEYDWTDNLWKKCGTDLEVFYDIFKYLDSRFETRCIIWYDN